MLRSYFKIALRNIKSNKVFSFINIFGLSIGLTCCILITLYIVHETSYDKFQQNGDRIFQIATVFTDETGEHKSATTAAPLGRILQQDYPEVEASTKLLSLYGDDKTLFQVYR